MMLIDQSFAFKILQFSCLVPMPILISEDFLYKLRQWQMVQLWELLWLEVMIINFDVAM